MEIIRNWRQIIQTNISIKCRVVSIQQVKVPRAQWSELLVMFACNCLFSRFQVKARNALRHRSGIGDVAEPRASGNESGAEIVLVATTSSART